MATRAIILGSDNGTFWSGDAAAPWSDDPSRAKAFASAREAWTVALSLQDTQGEYLEDSPLFLYLRDDDDPRSTRPVTSSVHRDNRPVLRRHWREGFREALPPDLPARSADPAIPPNRLADYLHDTHWEILRARSASPGALVSALDPAFRSAFTDLLRRDRQAADDLLKQHVPADLANRMQSDLARSAPHAGGRPAADASPGGPATEPNEITRDREREAADTRLLEPGRAPATTTAPTHGRADESLPVFVRRHFVRAENRFYHRHDPERLAFSLRGERIRAHDASVGVATALVELAAARGWSALKVQGSREFRRLVWTAAHKRGLAVDGYTPSAAERAVFEQAAEGRPLRGGASSAAGNEGRERDRHADPLAGVLVDHGAAPYRHRADNAPSYFVSLRQTTGEVITHWGLDLKRATQAAGAAIGDRVQLVREGRDRVQVREPVRDEADTVIDYATRETARTAWSVTVRAPEASEPANERTDALAEKVVALFTARHLATLPPEIQERFRALYDEARARLTPEQGPRTPPGSAPSPLPRERSREHAARGR
jgi:hypothetical protein